MRATYDTDAMRGGARELDAAAASLRDATRRLDGLHGAVPAVVADALDRLGRRGGDVVHDIADEGAALTEGLRRAALAYDDLDASIIRAFTG